MKTFLNETKGNAQVVVGYSDTDWLLA